MLFANNIFQLDGHRYRLLTIGQGSDEAWCIDIDAPTAWPVAIDHGDIRNLSKLPEDPPLYAEATPARRERCDRAYPRLMRLLDAAGDSLFYPSSRNQAIKDHAKREGCAERTLHKDLRRYWTRGQNKMALLPDYQNSGRSSTEGLTSGRGRPSKSGIDTYQLCTSDLANFRSVIESRYLKDQRVTMVDAYMTLLEKHYFFSDGNQVTHINPIGERPSQKQLSHFVKKAYNIETRLRGRLGDKDFERDHRKKLGTVLEDCLGVGHYYEIDSTIGDIYLVSSKDVRAIIGKPTIYLIVDRKSRLIVGFYFGLENASWVGAMQAVLSISEDKRRLCQRYGVEYNESDWPAHQVFPSAFLADRGDMISQSSNSIVEGVHSTIANLPSKRPDHKPLVECGFRQAHNQLRTVAPAYDPPSNATKRRGKRYDKDACLTVNDFGNLMLNAIVHHNRRAISGYELTPNELIDGVDPNPIDLWNHGVATRAGQLRTYEHSFVRRSLLAKGQAVVTAEGISFNNLYYTCSTAIDQKWFENARQRRFVVDVLSDPRLVDEIYVRHPTSKDPHVVAKLTVRSTEYNGMSFAEVAYFTKLKAAVHAQSAEARLHSSYNFRKVTKPTVEAAKKQLKAIGTVSRTYRRADTKESRHIERIDERRDTARLSDSQPGTEFSQSPDNVVPLAKTKMDQADPTATRIAQIRRKMMAELNPGTEN
ncbi:Mu transposase C-terminal domain-containing protein [Achromobacter mucicolens]|uniref:Mu transposase C-terminal domain-containing protein n=1 Tax=Achromobacter mucicolens TaxID=1389922 RepID=UPI0039763932